MHPGRTTLVTILAFWDVGAGLLKVSAGFFAATLGKQDASWTVLGVALVAWGVLSLAAGHGLWRLRGWGRTLQMILGVLSLPLIPFGTGLGVVTLVALTRAPIRDLFRGDAVAWDDAARAQLRATSNVSLVWFTGIAGIGAATLPIVAIISAIAIPNLLNAIDRGRQKRTMADIRFIGTAVESYAIDNEKYPEASSFDEMSAVLEGPHAAVLPKVDGWGHPLRAISSSEGYVIASPGKDGVLERDVAELWEYAEEYVLTSVPEDDIVFANGQFFQAPESVPPR